MVFYDDDGRVEAIEFVEPGRAMLGGVDLLGMSYADLVKLITEQDPEVMIENDGFTSEKLGIGSYAPGGIGEPEDPAETVIVFPPGYYDG
ncbi:hypothetical protein [Luteolibacter soli]|uniref:Uncharacterized protein n=1 Tax=Luteolibacter soli TaxID=3135280 RepID=A0ABU9AVY2_9BACT